MYKLLFVSMMLCIAASSNAQTWKSFTTANTQITSDTIGPISVDPSGNIWVCLTGIGGFGKLNGTLWTDDRDSVGGGDPQAVYYYEGNLWVYSYNGPGDSKYNASGWNHTSIPNNDGATFFTSDNKGQFWASGTGVSVLRTTGQWNHFSTSQAFTNLRDNGTQVMAMDSNGNAYVSYIYYGGVTKLNATTGAGVYFTADSTAFSNIPTKDVCSIAIDGSGNIWCATSTTGNSGKGVYRIKADGSSAYVYSSDSSISWISDNVRAVAVDHCNNVWIGTDAGAAKFDGANWSIYNTFNTPGLVSDSINSIYVDAGGHIWFSTDQGLVEYEPAVTAPAGLAAPANKDTLHVDSTICSWYWDCPNVTRNWFEIADNPNFTNSTIDTVNLTYPTGLIAHAVNNLKVNTTYYWRVKEENDQGYGPFSNTWTFTVNPPLAVQEQNSGLVNAFELQQNYPNPFTNQTTINFSVPQREHVTLKVYDVLGREVATVVNDEMERGDYSVPFDISNLSQAALHSGWYRYSIQAGDVHLQNSMQIVR